MANEYKVFIAINVFQKTNYWIAYCPALKTFGYSKESKDAALKDFDDALKTFFHVQDKLGKLDETLRTLGWRGTKKLSSLTMPQFPNYSPEKRYRANNAQTVEREILVPA